MSDLLWRIQCGDVAAFSDPALPLELLAAPSLEPIQKGLAAITRELLFDLLIEWMPGPGDRLRIAQVVSGWLAPYVDANPHLNNDAERIAASVLQATLLTNLADAVDELIRSDPGADLPPRWRMQLRLYRDLALLPRRSWGGDVHTFTQPSTETLLLLERYFVRDDV